MTETELAAKILAHCINRGLLVHHCSDSRRCKGNPGLPDMIIVSGQGVLFAELKVADGDTSADQDLWLYKLHCAHIPWIVWRPQDWEAGRIQNHLNLLAIP